MSEKPIEQQARDNAERRLQSAVERLRAAATQIAAELEIPDQIAGHAAGDLIARIAYVPALAADLRRTAAQTLARDELRALERQIGTY